MALLSIIYYKHGFFYTVMKSANLAFRQQHFLSKQPNIMFAYTSTYTVSSYY